MEPKDILQLESSNTRQAYLFEENGHWYAYERSANRIEKFLKGFADFKHRVQDRNQYRHAFGEMLHYIMRGFNADP